MTRFSLVWSIVIVLSGCGGDDSDDEIGTDASGTTDTSTDGTDVDESGSSTSTTEDTTDTTSTTEDTTDTTEGPDTTDTTDTDTTDGTETGGECPSNPNASPCEMCVLESCCDELLACQGSVACSCVFDCVEQGNELPACHMQCGLNMPDLTYGEFVTCVQFMCPDQCA